MRFRISFSWSRKAAAFSNSCAWIADSFSLEISSALRSRSAQAFGHRRHRKARPRPGFIDHVDRLVGKKPSLDVALRQVNGLPYGRFRELRAVMRLVFVAQPHDDPDRLVFGRRIDDDGLETPLEGAVLLDVLAVLVKRRRADALDLAAGEGRLEHVGSVDRALRAAGAHDRMDLVDEDDDLVVVLDLVDDRFQALLELSAVLRAGDDRGEIERRDALVAKKFGHLSLDDLLGEPLDDGGLPDTGFTDENGIVLLPAAENLDDPADLLIPSDDRIELEIAGVLREIAPELVERRGFGLPARVFLGTSRAPGSGEAFHDLLADPLPVDAELEQNPRRHALPFPDEPEQKMLRSHIVVPEETRLLHRKLEDPLRPRRERYLPDCERAPRRFHHILDGLLDLLEIDLEPLQNLRRDSLAETQNSEEKVLRADVIVLKPVRLVPREIDDFANSFGKFVVHILLYVSFLTNYNIIYYTLY